MRFYTNWEILWETDQGTAQSSRGGGGVTGILSRDSWFLIFEIHHHAMSPLALPDHLLNIKLNLNLVSLNMDIKLSTSYILVGMEECSSTTAHTSTFLKA